MPEIRRATPSRSRLAERLAGDGAFWAEWLRRPAHDLAENVLRLRRLRHMSQGQLAARMGTQQPAIARIESGRGSVSTRTLQKLAEALDATVRVTMEPVEEVNLARRSLSWWERGTAAGQREEPAKVIECRLHITVAAQAGASEAFALLSPSSSSRSRRKTEVPDVRRYTAARLNRTSVANDGEAQGS